MILAVNEMLQTGRQITLDFDAYNAARMDFARIMINLGLQGVSRAAAKAHAARNCGKAEEEAMCKVGGARGAVPSESAHG